MLKTKKDLLYDEVDDTWEHKLSAAIVYRACIDYEDILFKYLIEENELSKKKLKPWIDEVKIFFGSEWYYFLTDINHNRILEEVERKAQLRADNHKRTHKYYMRRHQFVWGAELTGPQRYSDKKKGGR